MNGMKIEHDKDSNVAYLYVKDKIRKGEAKKTISVNDDIILDFSKDMHLLGIEILDAKKYLPEGVRTKPIQRPA